MASRMVPSVNKVQSIIGYKFKNTRFLWEALQGPGAHFTSGELIGHHVVKTEISGLDRLDGGNKNLAQLGDSVMETVLYDIGYRRGYTPGKYLSSLAYSPETV